MAVPDRVIAAEAEVTILAFGDSLTAGYLLPPAKSFPAQLEAALLGKGYAVRVINAGVSGDTAAEGLARLEWSLTEKVDAAIVEFGANDALRGASVVVAEHALDSMLTALEARGIDLLVAGMESPRNWGDTYAATFRGIYPRQAQKHNALLYPFFLKDVATVARLNLADGIHPTPEGVAIVVRNIVPDVEALISRVRAKRMASGH